MQCYEYEALCRTLVAYVKERDPSIDFELLDAADAIDEQGIDSITRIDDLVAIARTIGVGIQRAA